MVVPADPTKYGLNPELDAADLKAAKKNRTVRSFMGSSPETWVLSNKKGGKIRKCQDGDEIWDPELEAREQGVLDMEYTEGGLNLSQKLPKLPWMTPIGETIELKPSGTIPAKKGAIDQVLELIRQSFQTGMNDSSKEFSKTQSKYISLGSNKNDGYGKNPNTGLGQTIFDGVMNGMGRGVAFLNTGFTNRQVLDTSLKGIRSKYLGAMKRMPVGQYYDRYSFMPIISTFNDQKTDARVASNQIVKGLSDQKMQLAQNNMTETRIAKGEQNLLDQVSKHITEKDLANIQRKNQFAKDEQAIAEYNQQLGGQQLAEEAGAWAQFYQKHGDNRNKLIAEFRTDNEKYQSAMDTNNAYKNLQNLYAAYDSETDPNKKLELKERISLLSYLIKNGANARNPITGQSALNV